MPFGNLFKKKEQDNFSDFGNDPLGQSGSGFDDGSTNNFAPGPGLPGEDNVPNSPFDSPSDSPSDPTPGLGGTSLASQEAGSLDSPSFGQDGLGNPGGFSGSNQGFGPGSGNKGQRHGAVDKLHQFTQAANQYTHPTDGHVSSSSSFEAPAKGSYDKDLELINAKLDSIKMFMESINHRLSNLERMADDSRKDTRW